MVWATHFSFENGDTYAMNSLDYEGANASRALSTAWGFVLTTVGKAKIRLALKMLAWRQEGNKVYRCLRSKQRELRVVHDTEGVLGGVKREGRQREKEGQKLISIGYLLKVKSSGGYLWVISYRRRGLSTHESRQELPLRSGFLERETDLKSVCVCVCVCVCVSVV